MHAISRYDRNLTSIYGTAWIARKVVIRRKDLHKTKVPTTVSPRQSLITELPTPGSNDRLPGLQEVSADERSRLAEGSGEAIELEAAQTGAGVGPFRVRHKSVLVNEIRVEIDSTGKEIRLADGRLAVRCSAAPIREYGSSLWFFTCSLV